MTQRAAALQISRAAEAPLGAGANLAWKSSFRGAARHVLKGVEMTLAPLSALFVATATLGDLSGAGAARVEVLAVGDAVFELRYTPDDTEVARQVARALERAVPVAKRWGTLAPVVITIHPTHEALEAAVRRHGYAWLRAWARRDSLDVQSPRTWTSGSASDDAMTTLLAHELTHCVMYQSTSRDGAAASGGIPRWFTEGMASVTAGQHHEEASFPSGRDAPGRELLATPESVYRSRSDVVYAVAHRAFRFLLDTYGEDSIRRLLAAMAAGAHFPEAFQHAIGIRVQEFEGEFARAVFQASRS